MRLLQLYLQDYRVLRELTLTFSELEKEENNTYTLSFLVGINGSGKSTALRALVHILRKLEQKVPISTPFRLEYLLGTGEERQHITISNIDGESETQTWIDGTPTELSSYHHLPRRIVIFTTGSEAEWEESQVEQSQDSVQNKIGLLEILHLTSAQLAIQELPGKPLPQPEEDTDLERTTEAQQDERFRFIKAEQIPLVTLCGLLADMATHEKSEERLLGDVLSETKIRFVRGFSLKFRMNKGTTSEADREYVEKLKRVATRALRLGTDYLLLFDLTEQDHTRARTILEQATENPDAVLESARGFYFFEKLARLAMPINNAPPILREVSIFFERIPDQDPVTKRVKELSPILLLDWLSDGEKSFLGRMCLFSLLGDAEALIILDEPEVHFNDYWKRQIVYLIDKVLRGKASHALITTHSSITLTDVPKENILVLDRSGIFTSDTFAPSISTYAADPSDIIVSVFGAPQASGAQSVNTVQEALRIRDPRRRKAELERLLKIVGPGYWRYRIRRELLQ